MAVREELFGKNSAGQEVMLYTLRNRKGMEACVTNVGATLVKLLVPDEQGNIADVILGLNTAEEYCNDTSVTGMVVGPHANRIAGASFEIDGVTYHLDANELGNNLHSHFEKGYQRRLWKASVGEDSVTFSLEDADGNMGFPGNKKIQVTYTLDDENMLRLHYHGTSDKKTILNLTNHAYFNLDGHADGTIYEHELWIGASQFTPVRKDTVPTGEIWPVAGTPMDFTRPKKIGAEINADYEQLQLAAGYDHNWVIDNWDKTLRHFATLKAPKSGRVMKVYTTLPGVQCYTGNFIKPITGKEGAFYDRRYGVCLETQYFPDGVHHDNFPSCVFGGEAGDYDSVTAFQFV